jgi:hypothetical protein
MVRDPVETKPQNLTSFETKEFSRDSLALTRPGFYGSLENETIDFGNFGGKAKSYGGVRGP